MKKWILIIVMCIVSLTLLAQPVTQTFNLTSSTQQFVVPDCVYSLTITAAGAEGGGNLGGDGTTITSTLAVNPGDILTIEVGGEGGCPGPGYNGGGLGWASTNGNNAYNSCGGGGATEILVNGVQYLVAAGGGGQGGGSNNVSGGNGGCVNGSNGANTYGSGGTGATQFNGGVGGTPWAGTPPGGQAGSLGQGGNGGLWQTASGGGGGGGYYGGGGGGNDGCCTGANGGGGGGGGSSLVPLGALCNTGNTGNGYVNISYILVPLTSTVNESVCSGDIYVFPDGTSSAITTNTTQVSTILSVNGCDSTITTNLTISPQYNIIENMEICEGDDFVFPDGFLLTNIIVDNTHISFLTTTGGCDSIITTQITVNPVYDLTDSFTICEGEDFTFHDGITITNVLSNTTHMNIFQTTEGCDSLILTTLNIIPLSPYIIDTTICLGDNYIFPDGTTQNNITSNLTQTSTLTSVTGCDSTITTNITLFNNPIPEMILSETGGCTSLVLNVSSPTPALSYTWEFNGGVIVGNPLNITSVAVGYYDVNLEIETTDGCIVSQFFDNAYEVYPYPISLFSATPNQATILDNNIYFNNSSIGGTQYMWDFGDGETSTNSNPYHHYSDTGYFVISLITQNEWGCADTSYGYTIIKDVGNIFVPNTFTPDSDEYNQVFKPIIYNVLEYHLTIFNRWGERVFESYNTEIGWDGRYSDEGLVEEGVYIWVIDVVDINQRKVIYRGHVTVLK